MNLDEFRAALERSLIQHELTLWAEITRREKSFVGRFKKLVNSMRCKISNGRER